MAAQKSVELPNHVTLPYIEQGDASGVPVLFLHGFADSWRSLELVLAHLPNPIHAFAITQRGHGDASRPAKGYRVHDFATDLWAFVKALDLEAAVIVGASSGGFAARHFAIEHADHTRGLALWGSPATLIVWGDQDTTLARTDQELLVQAIPGARLLIYSGAGHTFYWEEPARAASDLVAFIQGLDQERA